MLFVRPVAVRDVLTASACSVCVWAKDGGDGGNARGILLNKVSVLVVHRMDGVLPIREPIARLKATVRRTSVSFPVALLWCVVVARRRYPTTFGRRQATFPRWLRRDLAGCANTHSYMHAQPALLTWRWAIRGGR